MTFDLLKKAVSSIVNPGAGRATLFIDSATSTPYLYDGDTGNASSLVGVPSARQVGTTGYLQGGGDLSANRTLSLTTQATSAIVTVLNQDSYEVNVVDYGADMSGNAASDTALTNAIAALPAGGRVMIPAGVLRLTSAPFTISANNIDLIGAGANATTLKTNATTGDQLNISGYGCTVRNMSIQGPGTSTTSNKTAGTGLIMSSTEGLVSNVNFAYQYDSLQVAGPLVDVQDCFIRYFTHSGIVVNHNSDHQISRVKMNNAATSLPAGAGIDVQVTASLTMDRLNIINSNVALNVSPAQGVTVPSVQAVSSFFDTSAVGLSFTGAGSVFRSKFTGCWFSSMTTAGIRIQPATNGTVDGIEFVNCEVYTDKTGTTNGLLIGGSAGSVGKIDFTACSIAGWTTGVNIAATTAAQYVTLMGCQVGAISAFAGNGTGITVATGTYKGLVIAGCKVEGNTTAAFTLGTVTVAVPAQYRITDNPGINPRGAVTTPAVAASAAVVTNTTGFRVTAYIKGGVTSVVTVNGVATPSVLAAGTNLPVQVDPGGTIAVTYTTAITWVWVAN